jgi:hypothetical protein
LGNFPFSFFLPFFSFLSLLFSSSFLLLLPPCTTHSTGPNQRSSGPSSPPKAHPSPSPSPSLHGRPQTSSIFIVGQSKRMHTTFLLLSPPSILSEINSNLWILQDFIFQLNSDFISNSNPNPSRLLPHPNICLGATPPPLSTPISPQNQTLAATLSSTTSSVPLATATPIPKSSLQIKPCVGHEKPRTQP